MAHMLGDISNSPTSNYVLNYSNTIDLITLYSQQFLKAFCINIANQFTYFYVSLINRALYKI